MAESPLQAESACANPNPLSLYSATVVLEGISDDLAELSALVLLASQAADLDKAERAAFRAIATRLESIAAKAESESDVFLAAGRTCRPGLQ